MTVFQNGKDQTADLSSAVCWSSIVYEQENQEILCRTDHEKFDCSNAANGILAFPVSTGTSAFLNAVEKKDIHGWMELQGLSIEGNMIFHLKFRIFGHSSGDPIGEIPEEIAGNIATISWVREMLARNGQDSFITKEDLDSAINTMVSEEDLYTVISDYVNQDQFHTVVTALATKDELDNYIRKDEASVDLSDYITITHFNETMSSVASRNELNAYALKSDLNNLVTENELSSAISGFATEDSLGIYALKSDLNNLITSEQIQSYALKSDLNNYVSSADLSSAINTKADTDLSNIPETVDFCIESWTNGDGGWYRKYRSGWVEQGGIVIASSNTVSTVTFWVEMADVKYTISKTNEANSTETVSHRGSNSAWNRTVTGMSIYTVKSQSVTWEIKGFMATE